MKIGILTFWWSQDNYGQLLQCYALQKYLRNLGHDAYIIRYNYMSDIKNTPFIVRCFKALNPVKLMKFVAYKNAYNKHTRKVLFEQKNNNRYFDDFREHYINQSPLVYNSFVDLKNNPPPADFYIVGSDQVWNTWNYPLSKFINPLRAYFLDFGEETVKRMSYAASWGISNVSDEYREKILPLLNKFDYVSVREKKGMEICFQCGRQECEWVCDPTMLLSPESYRLLYKNEIIRTVNKKFLLCYILNNEFDFDINYVYNFAKEKEMEVIYVTGNGIVDEHDKYFATIPEWLYLVDNAEYVITNSFHCGVFSVLFNKQFCIIPLSGKFKSMNDRFESFFEFLNIENRYLINDDFSILDKKYVVQNILKPEVFISYFNNQK